MKRVMWIEYKGRNLFGPARIGWVTVRDKGKRLDYGEQSFRTLRGNGFKSNYYDIENREEYWISGCRKDGRDALYNTTVEIEKMRWTNIGSIFASNPKTKQSGVCLRSENASSSPTTTASSPS